MVSSISTRGIIFMKIKTIVCSLINGFVFCGMVFVGKIDLYSKEWFELFLLYIVMLLNCMFFYTDK